MSISSLIKRGYSYTKANGIGSMICKVTEHELQRMHYKNYEKWLASHLPDEEELCRQREECVNNGKRKFSILVPVYETLDTFLEEMIISVCDQSYTNWELCLADGSDKTDRARKIITSYQEKDHRIQYRKIKNLGIAKNTNEALSMATGDYICLLDHDDLLAPNALYEINAYLDKNPDTNVLYSDEDKIDMAGETHFQPHFKPDFDKMLLRSNNYICHLFCVKKEIADQTGGFFESYDGAQDYDFILRCIEKTTTIGHIPKILYHWRCHPASTAANPESKQYAYEAGKRAIEAHLKRVGCDGSVHMTENPGFYRVRYVNHSTPKVWIYTEKESGQSIRKNTAYPDFEIISNDSKDEALKNILEEKACETGYVLFLSGTCRPVHKGWLKELVSHAQLRTAGAVGGRIYNKKHELLYGAEVIGMFGEVARTPFYKCLSGFKGYMNKIVLQQECSVITSHCLMISVSLLKELVKKESFGKTLFAAGEGSMEEQTLWSPKEISKKGWNVELCLRLREKGYHNIYTPYAVFEMEEEKEKRLLSDYMIVHGDESFGSLLMERDPFYNPCLSMEKGRYKLDEGE